MSIIPCLSWVKRGVANSNPQRIELTAQELEKIISEEKSNLDNVENESIEDEEVVNQTDKTEDHMDEYNFDKYDAESGNIHCNIANIVSFEKDGKDPLITAEDDDSENENDIIKDTDNLLLVGHVEDDASTLEVYVYNESEGSFYCHHDLLLPSFPLCIEWLNFDPTDSKPCNLCAIGNMDSVIEVWDLDLIDCLEPAYKLGSKPRKKKNLKRNGHKDAVLDLAWNETYTHVLASGSVDQTVLLWDLEVGVPVNKFTSFKNKVQALKWNPGNLQHLLVGSADKGVKIFDGKQEECVKSWKAMGEVERVLWNRFDLNYCIASTANGYLHYIDIRQDEPVWNAEAHTEEVAGLALSSSCPGLVVTSGNDGFLKVWDIINNAEPFCVCEEKSNLGSLLCLESNPDNPFTFAVGGDNKAHNIKVYDLSTISEVRERFEGRGHIAVINPDTNKAKIMDVTGSMDSLVLNPGISDDK
ncbi:periodic tryptophan protein 1 homolog [Ceratina calcarata]|uniref:Periodic tryptophan protein 1 homolog n=1 Tax=Ceratina calcarata TaxID=156304 RepID=A0AAJ7ND37_9HYME|nr:periodic tryptophan protein 1 homolog [Ceratina calcarata]